MEVSCIALGKGAQCLVRRGFMKEKSTEELLAILDKARSHNLTHITDNIREQPSFICNCCSCCCELMLGVQAGYHDGVGKTPFLARIDKEVCNGCGLCVPACNVNAITAAVAEKGSQPRACGECTDAVCVGCGAWLPVCQRNALFLGERPVRPLPPEKRKDMFKAILWEKGRLKPYLVSGMKKKLRKIWPGC